MPVAVLDIDLFRPLEDIFVSFRYDCAEVLLRWRGTPVARTSVIIRGGCLRAVDLWQTARLVLGESLTHKVLDAVLPPSCNPVQRTPARQACTVIVCTRNRSVDLKRCLDSLCACPLEDVQILVVDNAPSDESTAELVSGYPVTYTREPRKGLNWARARGVRIARHDLLLFTDDDVVVDDQWISAMCEPFHDPNVAAVTGLIMPLELETKAQEDFEQYGGFERWFVRRTFTSSNLSPAAAGKVGAGASMAVRRRVAANLRIFEVEMDCGTPTLSGGDHYAFYRLLRAGHAIVFNPEAVCWHRHRRTSGELRSTLYGYSVGVYCFLLRCVFKHGDLSALRPGIAWLRSHHVPHLWSGLRGRPQGLTLSYTLAEIQGVLAAPKAYWRSRRAERSAWICDGMASSRGEA